MSSELESSKPRNARRWWTLVCQIVAAMVALTAIYLAVGLAVQSWFAGPGDPELDKLAKLDKGAAVQPSSETPNQSEPLLPGILAGISQTAINEAEHPLDPLLAVARLAQSHLAETVFDYEAVMVNQVQISDQSLREPQFMQIKIRHERNLPNGEQVPLSIYTRFLKPASLLGQEAIWVRGVNEGRLVGHPPSGMLNLLSVNLDPQGAIAMKGNRYPIYEMGIARLLEIIIAKGERDRGAGDCEVLLQHGVQVDDRPCVLLEIRHATRQEPFDFHVARIFVDLEYQIPVAYEGYDWPAAGTNEPVLLEKYVYTKIRLNPGFTDLDFDPANPEYDYPDR